MLYLNSICKGERAVAHVVIFRWCEFHARRRQSAYFTERPSLAEPGKWYVSAAAFHTAACCPLRSLTVPGNTSQAGSYDLCPRPPQTETPPRRAAGDDSLKQRAPNALLQSWPMSLSQNRLWTSCRRLLYGPTDLGIEPLGTFTAAPEVPTSALIRLKRQSQAARENLSLFCCPWL